MTLLNHLREIVRRPAALGQDDMLASPSWHIIDMGAKGQHHLERGSLNTLLLLLSDGNPVASSAVQAEPL
jgi:hypothetical protein